jgi:hypothetical protein
MAEQFPRMQFEDVPLEEARRMGRGPRMEMKNRILRVAAELGIQVMIRNL